MLDSIIRFSVRNKLIVALLVLFMSGLGVYEVYRLPIDAVPDITDNQVLVITSSPALGAPDVERLITFPVEQACANIPGLRQMRSFSRFGLSLVTLVFTDETDVYWARQQVSERLQQVRGQIPPGLGEPEMAPVTTGLGEIYQYVLRPKPGYADRYSLSELRSIQDWQVRRQLLGVPGVADVSSFGGKLKQFQVRLDPSRLRAFNISIDEVFAALDANNQNTGGAYIEKGPAVLYIRSEGLLQSIDDIALLPVKQSGGKPILIRDLGAVEIGHAVRYGAMTYNDEGETVGAVVMMLKGANSNEVVTRVKQRVVEIQKSLPEGLVIEAFLDRSKMVNNAIKTVETNLLEGALIVVFILVLFLANIRAGLIVASIIPLSMLFAVIMMNAFGVSGNLMSLGALDFGLIVDGAVIIVEAVIHRLHGNVNFRGVMRLSQTEMDDEVMKTSSRMMRSAVFGQLVILVVYLPIFTLEGIEGKMFKPMAQTVVFALLGAFLLSLTYIPMMSALFLDRKTGASHSFVERWFSKLEAFYIQTLNFLMRFPLRMALAALILFSGACWKLFTMGGEFIPQLEEGDFAVDTRVLSGSSLNTTVASTQQTAGLLKARFPEVIKVVTKIGSGEIPTDPMPMEASDMMVILKPKKEWTSAKTFPELAEKMSEALNEVPGVTAGFQFPVQMRFNELMTGARQDVVIKIFGDNLDSLAAYADRLGRLAGRVSGIRDVYVEKVTGLPQIVIRHNREALRRYDVSVASVNRVIRAAFAGETAGQMYEGDQRYDLTVTLQKPVQQNLDDIGNTPVMTGNGQLVPLRTLATIAVEVGPNQIQRENTKRRIVVGFNVRGRDVQSVVQDIRIEMTNHLRMAPGYYVAVGGAFENLEKAKWRLAIAVPVAMLLIFALLYFAFHSLQLSVLIFTAVPLSAIGGVLGLTLRDMPFSISAGVGFIALFGVAVLNGIVLIAEFERLKKSGIEDLEEIVKTGGRARLRPVLMTAAVASLGFLPMALSNGAGAEVQRPLASVVIGGLVVATFLTLVLLPSLYIYIHRVRFFGMQQAAAVSLLLIALMLPGAMQAQPLGLSDALRLAKAQYPGLKAQEYRETLARQQQKAAFSAPNAEVSVEYGKLNTDLNDTRLQLQQRFPLPTITAARRKMAASTVAERRLEYMTTGAALTRDVTRAYVMLVLEKRRLTEAESFDKALTMALEKTRVRHRTGEATTAELAAMETQVVQHRQAMSRIKMDTAAFARRLRFYTGLQHVSELSDSTAAFSFAELRENQVTLQEKLLQQREKTAKSEINLEKARWAPDVRVGWAAMTFAGMPDKNGRVLDRSDYFSAFMVGLDIPLLAHVRARDVAQAKTRAKITAAETDEQKALLKMQKAQVLLELQEIGQQLEVYYTTVKPAVEQSQRSLQNQLDSGLLSVMEWGYLAQQNWLGRALYFDLWRAYQEAATEWIFLNTTDDGLKN